MTVKKANSNAMPTMIISILRIFVLRQRYQFTDDTQATAIPCRTFSVKPYFLIFARRCRHSQQFQQSLSISQPVGWLLRKNIFHDLFSPKGNTGNGFGCGEIQCQLSGRLRQRRQHPVFAHGSRVSLDRTA